MRHPSRRAGGRTPTSPAPPNRAAAEFAERAGMERPVAAALRSRCSQTASIYWDEVPIYEYRCPNGHTFEVMQRMSDDPVSVCEVCGEPVQRVFHPVAVHFKGSGFYSTDYGRNRGGGGGKDEGGGSKDDSSKTDTSASK